LEDEDMIEDGVKDESEKVEPKPVGAAVQKPLPKEIGGAKGPEPTRYGDWEHKGRCTDF
jgi:hypothetical protein